MLFEKIARFLAPRAAQGQDPDTDALPFTLP